jgi:hypothetical protein
VGSTEVYVQENQSKAGGAPTWTNYPIVAFFIVVFVSFIIFLKFSALEWLQFEAAQSIRILIILGMFNCGFLVLSFICKKAYKEQPDAAISVRQAMWYSIGGMSITNIIFMIDNLFLFTLLSRHNPFYLSFFLIPILGPIFGLIGWFIGRGETPTWTGYPVVALGMLALFGVLMSCFFLFG